MNHLFNDSFEALLTQALSEKVEQAAKVSAKNLKENISRGSRSGTQYSSLPYRSSTEDEFPQEQFGDLKASVEANPTNNPLAYEVGFFGDVQGKLNFLEFGSLGRKGRAPIQRTITEEDNLNEMLKAML